MDGGKVTVNNPRAAAVLDLVRSQIGVTTPRGVTTYQEGEAHTAFVTGNAAFMRNWPYAYSIGADPKQSKIVGKFSVTVLPHGAGGNSVGTVGGWQLAVSKFSKHPDATIEFVRYMTSPAVQKFDAITNTNVPTIPSVAKDPAVVKVNPYLKPEIAGVARVARPSTLLGPKYNEGSKQIYQAVNRVLNGTPAKNVLPGLQAQLQRLLR
jgi:trehalose/maltose transport system substrate-binding protein